MVKYLIDANLPHRLKPWHSDLYIHQKDLNPKAKDKEIWQYATANNLTIITKDTDFYHRILLQEPPPRVICIKVGNKNLKQLREILSNMWIDVLNASKNNKLVNVYEERMECIK